MSPRDLCVLLVEDNPRDADLLEEALAGLDEQLQLARVERIQQAAEYLGAGQPANVILLDLGLPDSTGLETLERANGLAPQLPIIVLTGLEDEAVGIEAVRRGAQDYLVKGEIKPRSLVRAIRHAVARKRLEERMLLLSDITSQLLSSEQPQQLVESLCRKVMAHLDCQAFFNFLVDEQQQRLRLNACAGIPEEAARQIQWLDYGVAVCGCAARDGCRIVAEHVQTTADPRAAMVRGFGIQAYACHPLLNQGEVIGTLSFGSRTRPAFAEDELALMKAVTDHVAIAMQRIRMRESLQRHACAAQAASQAKSQFLANMSHELRTPMTAILGMTDLALAEELSPPLRDYLQTTKQSADALLELLNEVLDFSRIEAGRFELESTPFVLRELVEQVIKTLGMRASEKGLELACDLPADLPSQVVGDPLRLRQVLMNLVGNAVKFTRQGQVVVALVVKSRAPREIELEFSVADTGIGISPEDQQRIFAPFTQADPSTTRHYGGSGLGLAIAQRLVNLMGGGLSVESRPGQGSTFRFTARLALAAEIDAEPELPAVSQEAFRDLPVLVVAENLAGRRMLEQTLSRWAMCPDSAGDVPSALMKIHQAASAGHSFRLVLADALMPDVDGLTLAEWLQKDAGLSGPVILMFSAADRRRQPKRFAELATYCLEKPISQSTLFNAVARSLGLAEQSAPGGAGQPGAALPAPHRLLRVLLAEDTPANQKLVLYILGRRGHRVEAVPNGQQALERLRQEDFDVVLMDVQMPVMDGFQATAAVRKFDDPRKARVPIIAMTAHALKGDRDRCLEAGMDAYISKPIKSRDLIELVERLGGTASIGNSPSPSGRGPG
jgi:signal transduction histidine kinase/DNA-binding response OmpR family regulator